MSCSGEDNIIERDEAETSSNHRRKADKSKSNRVDIETREVLTLNNDLITINQSHVKARVREALRNTDADTIRQLLSHICLDYKDIWTEVGYKVKLSTPSILFILNVLHLITPILSNCLHRRNSLGNLL